VQCRNERRDKEFYEKETTQIAGLIAVTVRGTDISLFHYDYIYSCFGTTVD
jgi:hypothetical protein